MVTVPPAGHIWYCKHMVQSTVFEGFTNRDRDLRAVTRYSLYKVMLYRSNLFTHAHRTATLVRAINPLAVKILGPSYNPLKAELIALVHDDAEIEFGDIQAGNKSKMTAAQLSKVRQAEEQAIEKVAARFPKTIAGYTYKTLLQEAADYSSPEAQVVCYADKYDALGEALHEIFAGNYYFTTHVTTQDGTIPTPTEYYASFFSGYRDKFPAMQALMAKPFAMFEPVVNRDYSRAVKNGKPYTANDIAQPSSDHHYETWRTLILAGSISEVVNDLVLQKEFLAN